MRPILGVAKPIHRRRTAQPRVRPGYDVDMNTWRAVLAGLLLVARAHAQAPGVELDPEVARLARQEVPAVLETLQGLTAVDSGTGQAPGLLAVADLVERFVRPLGGEVQRMAPASGVAGQNLVVTFRGQGRQKIMFMAHMDTVYAAGTAAARPFRVEGNRAYAPGIADDKSGVAVFLHAVKLLKARGFDDYERITLVFDTDEERSSVGSRELIRSQAAQHDAVLSGEPTGDRESVVLGTSGSGPITARVEGDGRIEELADFLLRTRDMPQEVPGTRMNWTILRAEEPRGLQPDAGGQLANITWRVRGRASHAGVSPQLGVNAVVEAASLVQRVGEAAAREEGVRVQWRSVAGGQVSNVIPEQALAVLEVAVPQGRDPEPVTSALARAGTTAFVRGAAVTAEVRPGPVEAGTARAQASARADVRVPTPEAMELLAQAVERKAAAPRSPATKIVVQHALNFPPFNATPQGEQLAQLAVRIRERQGARLEILARGWGATDSAWAGQSGQPVLEGFGLPGGNVHAEGEYIRVDRIADRLALVVEMVRAIAAQR